MAHMKYRCEIGCLNTLIRFRYNYKADRGYKFEKSSVKFSLNLESEFREIKFRCVTHWTGSYGDCMSNV